MQGKYVVSLFLFSCLIQLSPSQEPANPDLADCDQQIKDCLDKYHVSHGTQMDRAINNCIQLAGCLDYAPAPMSLKRTLLSADDHAQGGVSGLISCKAMVIIQVLLTAFYVRFCC